MLGQIFGTMEVIGLTFLIPHLLNITSLLDWELIVCGFLTVIPLIWIITMLAIENQEKNKSEGGKNDRKETKETKMHKERM